MGLTLRQNGADMLGDTLYIEDRGAGGFEVAWSARIGISVATDRLWRCYVRGHPSVSGRNG
jgi:3-methyladenine DNA glycosylase Mpg